MDRARLANVIILFLHYLTQIQPALKPAQPVKALRQLVYLAPPVAKEHYQGIPVPAMMDISTIMLQPAQVEINKKLYFKMHLSLFVNLFDVLRDIHPLFIVLDLQLKEAKWK